MHDYSDKEISLPVSFNTSGKSLEIKGLKVVSPYLERIK